MAWFTTIHGDSADQPPFRAHKHWHRPRPSSPEADAESSADFLRMLEEGPTAESRAVIEKWNRKPYSERHRGLEW